MRVLELFSGIGGLHWALKESEVDFEIMGAMEINPVVSEIYALNFPDVNLMARNIESLTAAEINDMEIDAILMSPPCQPFCRTGLKQGSKDSRSEPLNQILKILPEVNFKYIFVENVHGFESSDAHEALLETLRKCNFKWQEFSLNPLSLGVPNSRLRYYLIGKEASIPWRFDTKEDTIMEELPEGNSNLQRLLQKQKDRWTKRRSSRILKLDELQASKSNSLEDDRWQIGDVLEFESPKDIPEKMFLPENKVLKYLNALDIVTESSSQSCCFTKAYFHYLTGTGSILDLSDREKEGPHKKLRYFTPREVSRLLCYPEEFQFPKGHSAKQCYRALGNSVNVYVISLLFSLLFNDT